jgi:hypothetical protein
MELRDILEAATLLAEALGGATDEDNQLRREADTAVRGIV